MPASEVRKRNGAERSSATRALSAPDTETAAALRKLPVALVMNMLSDRSPSRLVMHHLRPATDIEGTLAGPARTIRYLPTRHDHVRSPFGKVSLELIDTMETGEVLVLAANGFEGGAVLGDMMALRAMYRGAAAIIADGAIRDVAGVTDSGMSVFCRSVHPMSGMGDVIPWETDVPVNCDGVLVCPGDWILADRDAAVVVPADLLPVLTGDADRHVLEDAFSCDLLRRGHLLKDVHPLTDSMQQHVPQYADNGHVPPPGEVAGGGERRAAAGRD